MPGQSSLSVELLGAKQLYELGRALRDAPKEVQRETRKALNAVTKPLTAAVKAEIPTYMPKGYEQTLARSLRIRTQVKTDYFAHITLVATAVGAKSKRDIKSLEQGRLRHPVYGRSRVSHRQRRIIPNPWVVQRIRSGFWTEPIRGMHDQVRRELATVISTTLRKVRP